MATTIACPGAPVFTTPTATDACDAAPSLTSLDVNTPGNCAQNYSVTRTWTAKDACGNTSTASQTINVEDKTPPAISSLPVASTIASGRASCRERPKATDACEATPSLTSLD